MLKRAFAKSLELIKNGFAHILVGGVATKVIAFVSSIVVVRLLTKDEYAVITYTDNIYNYVYLLSGMGFASGVLKYCVGDDEERNRAFFYFALKWGVISQVVFTVAALTFFVFADVAIPEARPFGTLLMFYPCVYYLTGLLQAMMRANLMNRAYAWIGVIQTALLMVLSIILVKVVGTFGVIPARYVSGILSVAISILLLRKHLVGSAAELSTTDKREFVSFSIDLLLANLFSMIIPINESFLVNNIVREATAISNYKVAALIPSQVSFFTNAVMIYFTPHIAKMRPDRNSWEYVCKIEMLNLAIILTVTVIGMMLTPVIIEAAYGSAYLDSISLSMLLWISYGINSAFRMVPLNALPMLGFSRFNLVIATATCAAHLVLDALFIWMYGLGGAVIASIVVYGASAGFYWTYLRKKTLGRNQNVKSVFD